MGKTRGWLYKVARMLGDIEAISKGRVGRRAGRRMAGKMTGKALRSGCFIATACYGTTMADEVLMLSRFRDQYLEKYPFTRVLIRIYYMISPGMARFIKKYGFLKALTRLILTPLIRFIKLF